MSVQAPKIPGEAVPPAVSPGPRLDPAAQIASAFMRAVVRYDGGATAAEAEADLAVSIREALRSYR